MLSTERQARRHQLFTLEVRELAFRFNVVHAHLYQTIVLLVLYARTAGLSPKRLYKITALHSRVICHWRDLGDTVDAIQSHAVLSEQQQEHAGTLVRLLREQTAFLQAVTSPEDITPEWVAKRNALAKLACHLVGEDLRDDDRNQTTPSQLM